MSKETELDVKSEMLPCPFCGHSDLVIGRQHIAGMSDILCVWCYACGAQTGSDETEELVVELWNKRASNSTLERECERLQETLKACFGFLVLLQQHGYEWPDGGDKCKKLIGRINTTLTAAPLTGADGREGDR